MRTVLATAILGLTLNLTSSHAQSNVYSANIVGYVIVTNAPGQPAMLANPLDNGANDLFSLFPNVVNGASVYVFQGGTLQSSLKSKGTWSQNFVIPPGTGCFLNSQLGTNIFVGNVAGFSNGIALQAGITVLAGSPLPFSGNLTDTGTNTLNFGGLPNGTLVYKLVNGSLQQALKSKGVWSPSFTINPGEGFYLNSPVTTNITQYLQLQ